MTWQVREGSPKDWRAMLALYNGWVVRSSASLDLLPIDLGTWQHRCAPWRQGAGSHRLFVAYNEEGALLGFASSGPFRAKAGYAGSVETSIYVRTSAQSQGLGRGLYEALFAAIREGGARRAYAVIAGVGAGFHASMGFRLVGVLRAAGRKFGADVDVAIHERVL